MPYLSFDLDALDALPDVARSAGIDESQVAYGLLRLWRHAWRAKSDVVTQAHLSGFFQGDAERVLTALEAFGFVATANNGTVRVRGAERYLRVSRARSAAGKARAAAGSRDSNGWLVAGDPSSKSPANAGEVTSKSPALTPSSEQRAANSEQRVVARAPIPDGGPEFYGWAQEQRTEAAGLIPEPPPAGFNAWWRDAHGAVNGDVERLRAGYRAFLTDRWARERNCPWAAWAKQWAKYVPPEQPRSEIRDLDGTEDLYPCEPPPEAA